MHELLNALSGCAKRANSAPAIVIASGARRTWIDGRHVAVEERA
jgi:hypothetical protein